MKRRPDLPSFKAANIYQHSETGELVEFLGIAHAHGGDVVGIFEFIDLRRCLLIADQRGYDRGETFTPYGDALDDERAIDDEGVEP